MKFKKMFQFLSREIAQNFQIHFTLNVNKTEYVFFSVIFCEMKKFQNYATTTYALWVKKMCSQL